MSLVDSAKEILVAEINANPGIANETILKNLRKIFKALTALENGEVEQETPAPIIRVDPAGKRVFPKGKVRKKAVRDKACLECGEKFVSVTHFHTMNRHDMSLSEYRKKHKIA